MRKYIPALMILLLVLGAMVAFRPERDAQVASVGTAQVVQSLTDVARPALDPDVMRYVVGLWRVEKFYLGDLTPGWMVGLDWDGGFVFTSHGDTLYQRRVVRVEETPLEEPGIRSIRLTSAEGQTFEFQFFKYDRIDLAISPFSKHPSEHSSRFAVTRIMPEH